MSSYLELLKRPPRHKSNQNSLQNILEFLHSEKKLKAKPRGKLIKGSSKTRLNRSDQSDTLQNSLITDSVSSLDIRPLKTRTPSVDLSKLSLNRGKNQIFAIKKDPLPEIGVKPVKSLRILKRLMNEQYKMYCDQESLRKEVKSVNQRSFNPQYCRRRVSQILQGLQKTSEQIKKSESKLKDVEIFNIVGWETPAE